MNTIRYFDPDSCEWVVAEPPIFFKKGDRIKCIDVRENERALTLDQVYEVLEDRDEMHLPFSFMGFPQVKIAEGVFYTDRFVLVEDV